MPSVNLPDITVCAQVLSGDSVGWIWLSRVPAGNTTGGKITLPKAGFLAPDFGLQTPDGEIITLKSTRGSPVEPDRSGSTLLLTFGSKPPALGRLWLAPPASRFV